MKIILTPEQESYLANYLATHKRKTEIIFNGDENGKPRANFIADDSVLKYLNLPDDRIHLFTIPVTGKLKKYDPHEATLVIITSSRGTRILSNIKDRMIVVTAIATAMRPKLMGYDLDLCDKYIREICLPQSNLKFITLKLVVTGTVIGIEARGIHGKNDTAVNDCCIRCVKRLSELMTRPNLSEEAQERNKCRFHNLQEFALAAAKIKRYDTLDLH